MLCIPITLKSALHTASLKPILCIHSLIFQFRCHIRCDICGFTFIILIIFLYTTSLLSLLPNIISYKSTRYFPTCSHNFPKAGEARFQGRSRLFRLLGKFPYLGESWRILMAVSSKTSSKTRFYYAATRRISSAAVQPSIWA